MSFWDLTDGESAAETGTSFETGGGNFDPIPAGTQVKAAIDEAKWATIKDEDEEYISLRWTVLDGEYKNRKIFQKVRVNSSDAKKADKAKRMLAAIDANAGGKLVKLNKKPGDQDLMTCLLNKPMAILLQIWKMQSNQTGEDMAGNWVSAVAPLSGMSKAKPEAKEQELDDDIPW